MEEKKDKKSNNYIYGLAFAAIAGFAFGHKSGYNKAVNVAKKNFVKHWKRITINNKPTHLYFPDCYEDDIRSFFDSINDSLLELQKIRTLAEKVKED